MRALVWLPFFVYVCAYFVYVHMCVYLCVFVRE